MEPNFEKLYQAAYDLASEIHEAKWDHVDIRKLPLRDCYPKIKDELRRRCPGFREKEYEKMIEKVLHEALF